MAPRSRANKIEDGKQSTRTKIARFGPNEPTRASDQARWTKEHRGRPLNENPHIRAKRYSPAELARAQKHKEWAKGNAGRDAENPHSCRPDLGKPRGALFGETAT